MAGLPLLLVFIAGYAVQRGSICAVAAIEDLVERRPQRFLACFACAALALAVLAAAALLGRDMLGHYRGSSALLAPALGGALFGAGAWVNGRCAFGTIARLGGGEAPRLGTIAGLLAGFAVAPRLQLRPPPPDLASPLAGLDPALLLAAALALCLGLAFVVRQRIAWTRADRGWHPFDVMALIGVANGALLVVAAGWPYTSLLMDLAGAIGMDFAWRSLMSVLFAAGALAGAILNGAFRPEAGSRKQWARCLAGGLLMGLGAAFVPGGNDTMLLVGLPLLLPNFLIAYLAMTAALLALALGGRLRFRRRPVAA